VYAHLDSPEVSKLATELFIAHKRAYASLDSLRTSAPPEPSRVQAAAAVSAPPAGRQSQTGVQAPAETVRRTGGTPAARGLAPKSPSVEPQRRTPPNAVAVPPARAYVPHVSAPAHPTTPGLSARKRRVADAEDALQAGLQHLNASRFEQAETELERAETLAPDRRDVVMWLHVCRARRFKASGQGDGALREYRALLDLDPEHREALDYVGGRDRRKVAGLIGKWFGSDNE
jgi:tetratricopeptide (TPR) repeat protein